MKKISAISLLLVFLVSTSAYLPRLKELFEPLIDEAAANAVAKL